MARLVAAPDAVARFAGGSVVLHNARVPHPPLLVRDDAVLEVLLHFAQPVDPAALRARRPGWVNIDVSPAELALNVNRGLPFADGSARLLFASHMLEHLYYPQGALSFLTECRRVLQPRGRLRLVVPDIELYVRACADRDDAFLADRRRNREGLPEGRTHLEESLSYAGAGPDPAAFLDGHKYGYDVATLSRLLALAGFEDVRRSSFMGSDQPEQRVDEPSAVAGATSDGRHRSLFVEASAHAASPAPRPAP